MAYFYNFNFNEDVMYGMPIADMSAAYKNRRKIRINKEDDTIPRTTDPYCLGHVYYKVHEFPACVYRRCFWLEERDDNLAEEIRMRYFEARDKKKKDECEFCEDDTKDVFYEEFGDVEISVFINDGTELELYVTEQGEEHKKTVPIKFCPFCGRRLRND